jgi:hypothetical protein
MHRLAKYAVEDIDRFRELGMARIKRSIDRA